MARQKSNSPSFQSIYSELKGGTFHPVYFLSGDESYFIDQISDYIENHALNEGEKAFNQQVVYGKEVKAIQIIDTARQFPMMSQKRVIILKEAQEMQELPLLEPYIKNPSPSTILVISYKYKKLDGRKSLTKLLKSNSLYFVSKKLYDNQLPGWIGQYLQQKNKTADGRSLHLIAEYLGNDLSKISNEMDKLIINIGEKKSISPQDIETHVGISKDFNVFEFQNALAKKDKPKALRILQYFTANLKKNPLIRTNIVLFNFFTKVYLVQSHPHLDDKSLARLLKMSSTYFLNEYKHAARNFSRIKLASIFQQILTTDMRIKGVNNVHVSEEELYKELTLHIIS